MNSTAFQLHVYPKVPGPLGVTDQPRETATHPLSSWGNLSQPGETPTHLLPVGSQPPHPWG